MKYFTYIFIISFFVVSCGNDEHQDHEHKEVRTDHTHGTAGDLSKSEVEVGDLEYGWFEETIEANGTIELPPAGRRKMTQIHGGYVTSTDLLPGQKVNKGQVLCRLKNPVFIDLQKDYLTAKARGAFLKEDMERKASLLDKQGVSTKDFQKAKADYEENMASLAGLKAQLSLIGIDPGSLSMESLRPTISMRAPFNGYVTNVHINPGQYVGPTDVLFELIDTDHLHAHLEVFEKDAALLKEGQKVRMYSSYQPDEICEGAIFLIDKSLNEKSVMGVHVDLDQSHKDHLNVGMYIQSKIVIRADSAWVVPGEALVRDGEGREGIMVEKDGQFEWKEVKITGRNDKGAAILPFWTTSPPRVVLKNAYKVYASIQEEDGMDMGHSH